MLVTGGAGLLRFGLKAAFSRLAVGEVTTEAGIQASARLGREGEELAGITKNTTPIPSLSGKKAYRIPDELDPVSRTIGEVKNVKSMSYTSQIRDDVAYAQQQGYRFTLTVRPTTQLSRPLTEAVSRKEITLKYLVP
jgi:hypothetical protein